MSYFRFLLILFVFCPLFLSAEDGGVEEACCDASSAAVWLPDVDLSAYPCNEQGVLLLTAAKAVEIALEQNWSFLTTKENLQKAFLNIGVAKADFDLKVIPNSRAGLIGGGTAGEGPSVSVGANIEKKFKYGTRVSIGPTIMQANKIWHSDLNLLISQPLLRGFGKEATLNQVRAAEYSLRSACRTSYTSQGSLIIRTIKAVYDVVKQKETVRLNEESMERVRGFRDGARLKEKIGLSDSLDVYRAEIELSRTEDTLNRSKEQYQDSLDNLREILAVPASIPIEVEEDLQYHCNEMQPEECEDEGLCHRVEIEQAEDQYHEQLRLSRIAKQNLLPDISLKVQYANCGRDQLFSKSCLDGERRESTWGVGFESSTNANHAADRSAYEQSLMAIEQAKRNIIQTQQTIVREVRRSLRALARALDRIDSQETQIHTAEGELKLAKLKFDKGMGNNFDVIQAEKNLRQAKQNYIGAVVDHITEEVQLLFVMGVLMPRPASWLA